MEAQTYRLPNAFQTAELIYQRALENNYKKVEKGKLTELEAELGAQFASRKDDKIFARKIPKYSINSTSACEAKLDSIGKICTASTDTVDGQDDFLPFLIFQWMRCNYKRDADGTARVTALEGYPNYKTSGAVDIGTLSPTFYWRIQDCGDYYMLYQANDEHPELALVPFIAAVTADGMVLPYYIMSAYASVKGSDGFLRSQAGVPAYNASYNGNITEYKKKGDGYYGSGMARNLHGLLFYIMKYGNKSSQKVFSGCTNFNLQPAVAVAETGVNRVLVSNADGFYVGACVSIGTDKDRNKNECHSTVNRGVVKSIEQVTVNGAKYYAINIDQTATFNTTTSMYVSSMPCISGETDRVIGRKDGSYLSNTDSRHTFRIHGVEYMNGQWNVVSDVVLDKQGDFWNVYVAKKGTKHVANAHTDYDLAGKIPYNKGSDYWIGDFGFDEVTGSYFPSALGGGDSVGTGDRLYAGGAGVADGTLREYLACGHLWTGLAAGLGFVSCGYGLGDAYWHCGSCD